MLPARTPIRPVLRRKILSPRHALSQQVKNDAVRAPLSASLSLHTVSRTPMVTVPDDDDDIDAMLAAVDANCDGTTEEERATMSGTFGELTTPAYLRIVTGFKDLSMVTSTTLKVDALRGHGVPT